MSIVNVDRVEGDVDLELDAGTGISTDKISMKINGVEKANIDNTGKFNILSGMAITGDVTNTVNFADGLTSDDSTNTTHVRAARITSSQSITNNLETIILFNSALTDTLSEFNTSTGTFTATDEGYYNVSSGVLFTSAVWSPVTAIIDMRIYVNTGGMIYTRENVYTNGTTSLYQHAAVTGVVHMNASDTLTVRVLQNEGATQTLYEQSTWTYVTIDRIL